MPRINFAFRVLLSSSFALGYFRFGQKLGGVRKETVMMSNPNVFTWVSGQFKYLTLALIELSNPRMRASSQIFVAGSRN